MSYLLIVVHLELYMDLALYKINILLLLLLLVLTMYFFTENQVLDVDEYGELPDDIVPLPEPPQRFVCSRPTSRSVNHSPCRAVDISQQCFLFLFSVLICHNLSSAIRLAVSSSPTVHFPSFSPSISLSQS